MRKLLLAICTLALTSLTTSCYYDKKENLYPPTPGSVSCDTVNVTYSGTVRTILTASCTGCHSASNPSGGYNLSDHAGVTASASRLPGSIQHASGYSAMPKNAAKLSDCQIAQIERWLNAGAPNN